MKKFVAALLLLSGLVFSNCEQKKAESLKENPKLTFSNLQKIQIGMSKPELIALLGEPTRSWWTDGPNGHVEVWVWCRKDTKVVQIKFCVADRVQGFDAGWNDVSKENQ